MKTWLEYLSERILDEVDNERQQLDYRDPAVKKVLLDPKVISAAASGGNSTDNEQQAKKIISTAKIARVPLKTAAIGYSAARAGGLISKDQH